jgi:hypothetical protein
VAVAHAANAPSPGPALSVVSDADRPGFITDPASADDEPPWPLETEAGLVREGNRPTQPLTARSDQVLHVHFRGTDADRLVSSFEALRGVLRSRPGDTSVVLHIPSGNRQEQQMHLRSGVAYDAELVALISRSVGNDLVELRLN